MPMRVEGASSCIALIRLSIQRATQTLTTTKTVTVAIAFSTDQMVIACLALRRARSSRAAAMTGSSQPSSLGCDQYPDDQRDAQLPGLDRPALAERERGAGTSARRISASEREQRRRRLEPRAAARRRLRTAASADDQRARRGRARRPRRRRRGRRPRGRSCARGTSADPRGRPRRRGSRGSDHGELRIADERLDRSQQCGGTLHHALRSGISSLSSRRIWSLSRSLRFLRRRSWSSST